jgi:hypothetical protein
MVVVLENVGGKKKCSILYYTTFLISKGASESYSDAMKHNVALSLAEVPVERD